MPSTPAIGAPPRQHFAFIDIIRVIACFLVIMLHVSALHFYKFSEAWNIFVCYDSITRMAVPLFFMLSGFLIMENDITYFSRFYLRRYARILPPFIVICIFYYFSPQYKDYAPLPYIGHILTHCVDFHLWYIYCLIVIYLTLPFFIKMLSGPNAFQVGVNFIILWITVTVFATFIFEYFDIFNDIANTWILQNFFLGFIGYIICGWLIRKSYINYKKIIFILSIIIFAACTISIAICTIIYSQAKGTPDELFFNYLNPLVFFQTLSFFIACTWFNTANTFIRDLADKSFWIYLLHMLYLSFFVSVYPLPVNASALLFIPAFTIIVFSVSYLTAIPLRNIEIWIFRKIQHSVKQA